MNRVVGLILVWVLSFGFMAVVIGLTVNAPHLFLFTNRIPVRLAE